MNKDGDFMRTHFYDLLANTVIDPTEEAKTLCHLLSEETFIWHRRNTTLESYINEVFFRELSFRGSFINIASMRNALGVGEGVFDFAFPYTSISIEQLFLLSELLLAIAFEGEPYLQNAHSFDKQMHTIVENISHFVNKSNHRIENIGTDSTPRYIIVLNNKLTAQAVEAITEEPVALAAIEYNHFALRGNVSRKHAILNALANYVEPIVRSNKLKNNGYSQLQSDAGFLLNNFHIRHNNKTGTTRKEYIASISDKELEQWYDKAYTVLLSVIIEEQNVDTHLELELLKASYKW